MKDVIIARLKKAEEDIEIYDAYVRDKTNDPRAISAAAFAAMYEMLAFSALHELVPDYIPSKGTQIRVAQSLGGVRGYVTVVDGKVRVHQDYFDQLEKAKQLKLKGANGKVAEIERGNGEQSGPKA